MAGSLKKIQPAIAYAATHLEGDVSLAALARHARLRRMSFIGCLRRQRAKPRSN
jgi:hypothetical protein